MEQRGSRHQKRRKIGKDERFAGQHERRLYSKKKMESVQERMERLGTKQKKLDLHAEGETAV